MKAEGRFRSYGAFALLVGATVGLFFLSRGKWSDPLIDSGREWIVPDALARGDLLYRDVVYWFGPLTPYFQSLLLRMFGSGFGGLVAGGALTAAAALAALFAVLTRVTPRREAKIWTALAIPALVFMPDAGGALLGMGYRIWQAAVFALAAVVFASAGPSRRGAGFQGALAGACAGLAGLCRAEWGAAAIGAVVLACLLRARARRQGAVGALGAVAAFLAVFGAGLGFFIWKAGVEAVVLESHVLLTGLPLGRLASSGLLDWKSGLAELVYSTAMWAGTCVLALLFARPTGSDRARPLAVLVVVLAVLAGAAALGGLAGAPLFSAAPLVSLAALGFGLWRRRGSRAAALAACGALGLLLSYRRPFHIGDAAYVAPPLLFAFVCAAGLLRFAVASERKERARARLMVAHRWVVGVVVAGAFVGRAWQYASIDARPIAETSGMLTARPELARQIEELSAAIRREASPAGGLVVFPEGELLNFLSGRHNPIRHKLYLPSYLTDADEPAVLAELARARPAAIVIWRRPTGEYGRGFFGEDYGLRVHAWIDENYAARTFEPGARTRTNPAFTLFLPRTGSP